MGEAWLGLHGLPPNHSDYQSIKRFINNLPMTYRVLKFDLRAAAIWGELTAGANGPLPLRDSFIGAIARSRGYRIVTRDVGPFERMAAKCSTHGSEDRKWAKCRLSHRLGSKPANFTARRAHVPPRVAVGALAGRFFRVIYDRYGNIQARCGC